MLAQSRLLAMRKLSLRDPGLLNQSAGSTADRAGGETRQWCLYDSETQTEGLTRVRDGTDRAEQDALCHVAAGSWVQGGGI